MLILESQLAIRERKGYCKTVNVVFQAFSIGLTFLSSSIKIYGDQPNLTLFFKQWAIFCLFTIQNECLKDKKILQEF